MLAKTRHLSVIMLGLQQLIYCIAITNTLCRANEYVARAQNTEPKG